MTHRFPLRLSLAALLLAGASTLALTVFSGTPSIAQQRPAAGVSVSAAPAEAKPFDVVLNTVGTIRPWQSVVVRARVDGEIKALHFTEGQDVKAGDLLVEIDNRAIAANVAETQAQQRNFEAQLRQAQLDLERSRRLAANGNASAQSVDQLEAKVEQLKAQVASAAALNDAAKVQLDYTRITAPIDGRVGLRRVDAGNIVRAGDAAGIVTLNQLNPLAVVLTLPQQDLPRLQAALQHGAPVGVGVRAAPQGADLATGTISTLDNAIDESTGTVAIKAMLQNDKQTLWPGQAVMVRVILQKLEAALQVPAAAVQRGPENSFVYRITEGKAELVPVRVTYQNDVSAVIEGNIKAGDQVVTDGHLRIKPGSEVKVQAGTPAAGAGQ